MKVMKTYSKIATATLIAVALTHGSAFANEKLVAQSERDIGAERYTFERYLGPGGELREEIRTRDGRKVASDALPIMRPGLISPELADWLARDAKGRVQVVIALDLDERPASGAVETGEVEEVDGHLASAGINGRRMTASALEAYSLARAQRKAAANRSLAEEKSKRLATWVARHGLQGAEGMEASLQRGGDSLMLSLDASQIRALQAARDPAIAGIELYEPIEDEIDDAMIATNIAGWALPYANYRGAGIGIYMTESGCAAAGRFSNYTRLSGSETNHARNVGGIIRAVSPGSWLYCRAGGTLPQASELGGIGGRPPIHIVNMSALSNTTTAYTVADRSWDNFSYDYNVTMFKSAGNQGTGTGNVTSPGKGHNTVAVGNYSHYTGAISPMSSFVNPETRNQKPEVVAPGTDIAAGGFTLSGTSMAAPHAAAFTADMMSGYASHQYRPYLAKARLLSGATDIVAGGAGKVGHGGVDFLSATRNGAGYWWSGGADSWDYFDEQDGTKDGYITRTVYISAAWPRVRATLAWMNRGTHTYNNRTAPHPIGMDLGLQVLDPNGNYVAGSFSWDNPYETVNFNPTVSGYYTFRINRFSKRDNVAAVRMGLRVNYYNN